MKRAVLVWGLAAFCAAPAFAQAVSGTTFEDRNANGIKDSGEPAIPGVSVTVFGTKDVGGALDQTVSSAADGAFTVLPGNGCYLLDAADPAGWRQSFTRSDSVIDTTPG